MINTRKFKELTVIDGKMKIVIPPYELAKMAGDDDDADKGQDLKKPFILPDNFKTTSNTEWKEVSTPPLRGYKMFIPKFYIPNE